MAYDIKELMALPNEEKRVIAQTLWNDINEEPDNYVEAEKRFIEERLRYYKENLNEGISWEELKEQLKNKYGF